MAVPTVPTGLFATPDGPYGYLTWLPNPELDVDHYDVKITGQVSSSVTSTRSASFLDTEGVGGETRIYSVRAVTAIGEVSNYTAAAVLTLAPSGPAMRVHRHATPLWRYSTAANNAILFNLYRALFRPLEEMDGFVRGSDELEPYARPVDVEHAPLWALQWLSSVVGVEWRSTPTEDLRTLMRDRPRTRRGTPAAMEAAVRTTLTGSRYVRLIERTGGPWHDTLVVRPDEVVSSALTLQAAMSEKPAGRTLTYVESDSAILDEVAGTIDSTSTAIDLT